MKKIIYTIGTSTRRLSEFVDALKYYHVERVVDVRHFPTLPDSSISKGRG